jgi:hypothetical protein
MRLWLEDIFDVRNYVGEKKLNDNIIKNIKREIDLLFFVMDNFLEYKDDEIDYKEFIERFKNIKSNSLNKNSEIYNINKMKNLVDGNEKTFIDTVFDLKNVLNTYSDFDLNSKDLDMIKKYYNDKMLKYNKNL